MKKKILFYSLLTLCLNACIGTDEVTIEEQALDHVVSIEPLSAALSTGDTMTYHAKYFNLGVETPVTLTWKSSNPEIATISDDGLVKTITEGTTLITASYNQYTSKSAVLNVLNDTTKLAYILLSSKDQILNIGDSTKLSVQAFNVKNKELTNKEFTWSLTPNNIANITKDNYLKQNSANTGTVKLIASSESINSNEIAVLFSNNVKKGSFTSTNYVVKGQVSLMYDKNTYKLIFEDNFYAQNGPGLVIYVSNSNTNVVAEGKRIGVLPKNSGSFMIDISDKISALDQYKYVVIHCEPFNVPFGYAELN